MSPSIYTPADFHKFSIESKCVLDQNIINILQFIEQNIIIPDETAVEESAERPHQKTFRKEPEFGPSSSSNHQGRRTFGPNGSGGGNRYRSRGQVSGERYSTSNDKIAFKATKMETSKEGIEKQVNDIRILLNKISPKTYQNQKPTILEKIQNVLHDCEDQPRIINTIFTIASSNKMMAELYADLCETLVSDLDKYNHLFQSILADFLTQYKSSMQNIHYVDPNGDYDAFCKYNKINDLRKSSAVFIVHLMKRGLIAADQVLQMISDFQKTSLEMIDQENKINEVEETTENIFILVSMCKSLAIITVNPLWESEIMAFVKKMVTMKAKEHVSLSSRVVFKYMDL